MCLFISLPSSLAISGHVCHSHLIGFQMFPSAITWARSFRVPEAAKPTAKHSILSSGKDQALHLACCCFCGFHFFFLYSQSTTKECFFFFYFHIPNCELGLRWQIFIDVSKCLILVSGLILLQTSDKQPWGSTWSTEHGPLDPGLKARVAILGFASLPGSYSDSLLSWAESETLVSM